MSTRLMVAALVYPMVQAVMFGAGLIIALWLRPDVSAQLTIPIVVLSTAIASVPAAWVIAPRMMARYRRVGVKARS
ncbi:MAG: hypothetical protein A2882_15980 [Phenylobacterium sp. RIFCSPHIGHO2_01_FULL_70_10]|nr:MAG: hypothetical protein A2882_15980 [Phenylobacterium sp. RIFCSPHIGHO2_01_FULL_70_10]